jgi:hypothetical protein
MRNKIEKIMINNKYKIMNKINFKNQKKINKLINLILNKIN